jgi:hypothetical protein
LTVTRVQVQAWPERRRQRCGQAIVAARDAIHGERRGRVGLRELIHERDQRQLIGVGEEESSQPGRRRPQIVVGAHLIEPRGHGASSDVGCDRRVPAPLGAFVWRRDIAERIRQPVPPALGAAAYDSWLSALVGPYVPETTAQDSRQREAALGRQIANLVLLLVDHVAAGFRVLVLDEAFADRPDASADTIAAVDHRHGRAERRQIVRRREPREPRASDKHRHATEIVSHASTLNGNPRRLR